MYIMYIHVHEYIVSIVFYNQNKKLMLIGYAYSCLVFTTLTCIFLERIYYMHTHSKLLHLVKGNINTILIQYNFISDLFYICTALLWSQLVHL